MDYIIKIDNREKELIKNLIEKGYDIINENLDLGDIQILDLKTKEIIIIIERKTLSDLSSSIKDGRYKEQKERLQFSIKKSIRKIILIEGDNIEDFDLPLKTLNSVIINLLIRDNMHIYISKNIENTIEFMENLILQIPKYYDELKKEIIDGESKVFNNEFNCNIKKKENITKDICFRNMLCQIPGVSNKISNIFVNKYNNFENFIIELQKLNNRENIIKSISDEKNENRKIGEKLAEKIYYYIFNNNDNITLTKNKKIIKKQECLFT